MQPTRRPHQRTLEPGTLIENRYRISQLVASNSATAIYSATHLLLSRNVTLQLLTRGDDKAVRRFRRAGRLVSMMRHPNVISIHDMGIHDDLPYLVLEYLEGQSLAERSLLRGPLRLGEFAPIAFQLLNALEYVHRKNIIHRDVSAENVVFTKSYDGGETIKLAQFAFSKQLGGTTYTSQTEHQKLVQALTHVAPEQILSPESTDHRIDLYAAGSVLFRLLTGVPPFQVQSLAELGTAIIDGTPPPMSSLVDHVPASLEQVVLQSMAKNPEHRFESAAAMWTAIEHTLGDVRRDSEAPTGDAETWRFEG